MLRSLVGTEMCIKKRASRVRQNEGRDGAYAFFSTSPRTCLLYTTDAADEEDSVYLGGPRDIHKKTNLHLICFSDTSTHTTLPICPSY